MTQNKTVKIRKRGDNLSIYLSTTRWKEMWRRVTTAPARKRWQTIAQRMHEKPATAVQIRKAYSDGFSDGFDRAPHRYLGGS